LKFKFSEMADIASIKSEPGDRSDRNDIENRILQLCDENAKGIMVSTLQSEMPQFPAELLTAVVNSLLKAKKLSVVVRAKQHFLVRSDLQPNRKATGLSDHDEKLVYQIVENAGNKGIWEKDVRIRSKLPLLSTTKILKNLESRKLIKSVKSVTANRKKMYMLFDLEPDVSVTGGTWYSGQTFDSEFVKLITDFCIICLNRKSESAARSQLELSLEPMAHRTATFASSAEILQFIVTSAISKVKLSVTDIEAVMDALVYDGKVERSVSIVGGEQITMYRAVTSLIHPTGLMRMPCGLCPVIDECHEGGAISPSTCRYFKEWLDQKLEF